MEAFQKNEKFFQVGEGQSSGVWHPYGKEWKFKDMISKKRGKY